MRWRKGITFLQVAPALEAAKKSVFTSKELLDFVSNPVYKAYINSLNLSIVDTGSLLHQAALKDDANLCEVARIAGIKYGLEQASIVLQTMEKGDSNDTSASDVSLSDS